MFQISVETDRKQAVIIVPLNIVKPATAIARGRKALEQMLTETGDFNGMASIYEGMEQIASFVAKDGVVEEETIAPAGWVEIRDDAWRREDGAEIYRSFGRGGRQSFKVMRPDHTFIRKNHYHRGEGRGGVRAFASLSAAIAALSQ